MIRGYINIKMCAFLPQSYVDRPYALGKQYVGKHNFPHNTVVLSGRTFTCTCFSSSRVQLKQ